MPPRAHQAQQRFQRGPIALGVAAIGNGFFSRLGDLPTWLDWFAALSCNFVLQAARFLLVLLMPIVGRGAGRFAARHAG